MVHCYQTGCKVKKITNDLESWEQERKCVLGERMVVGWGADGKHWTVGCCVRIFCTNVTTLTQHQILSQVNQQPSRDSNFISGNVEKSKTRTKNYYVIRNAGLARSRNTWKLTLILYSLINDWIKESSVSRTAHQPLKRIGDQHQSSIMLGLGLFVPPSNYRTFK